MVLFPQLKFLVNPYYTLLYYNMLRLYAVGGFNGITRMNNGERYNPETNQWTNISEMYSPRSNFGIEVSDQWLNRNNSE